MTKLEGVAWKCSAKKRFWNILQNSNENPWEGVFLAEKIQFAEFIFRDGQRSNSFFKPSRPLHFWKLVLK